MRGLAFVALWLLAGCGSAEAPPEAGPGSGTPSRVLVGLDYGAHRRQQLDLYLPAGPGPHRVLVLVHGGAWVSGDRRDLEPVARSLVGEGLGVAAVGYRLALTSGVDHASAAADVAAALAWLRLNAGVYRVDPARIWLGGHSAGAHAVGLIATDARFLTAVELTPGDVAGYVGLEGIYDVGALVERFPQYATQFVGRAFGGNPEAWREASPALREPQGKAPWLLIHSAGDELVDVAQTAAFATRLRAAGVPVTVVPPDAAVHTHFGVVEALTEDGPLRRAILDFAR